MLPKIERFLFLDFETFYAPDYTLRSLTIPEYLLDERYETILGAAAFNDGPSIIIDGPDFGEWIARIDPVTTATVTFNALFDNSILAWHYGWVPALMLDSMNIARALRGHILKRLNLETICNVFGLPHDKSTILKVSGKSRELIQAQGLWSEFCDYAKRDNDRSRDIFKMLVREFPRSEMQIMDLVIRCAVQPKFILDKSHLEKHLTNVRGEKVKLLEACGAKFSKFDRDIKSEVKRIGLMSTNGFKKVLEDLGVEVKYKLSPAGGKDIPAFAKTDLFMSELQEHFDPRVQALACARLGVKSTIEETRTERLIKIASLAWDHYRDGNPRLYSGGTAPIPLRYAGAHTHRLSGDWRLNMQNMPAGRGGKEPILRRGFVAPLGHLVVVGDLAQIEARLVAWLAGCKLLLEEFAKKGGDPYSAFASLIFGFPVDKKLNPVHRFIGKTGVLGLGYQCGDNKFYTMVSTLARLMDIKIDDVIPWTKELAGKTVYMYRDKYFQVKQLWSVLQQVIPSVWGSSDSGQQVRIGPCTIRYGEIEGPNGLKLLYNNPRKDATTYEWVYDYGFGTYKMYGGKMLENIIQFIARIIIMNAALRLNDLGYRFVLQSHDELAFIVPIDDLANAKNIIYQELTRRPSWGMDIPLEAEVNHGSTYGDCK